MSRYPKLVIVGRPNVGKSALFNRLCNRRIAIVDEAEGVTRDRIYADADIFGRKFCLVDTGGIDPRSKAPFSEEVRRQSHIGIEEADVLVMVVDARVGITALDQELAKELLKINKPLHLAVNKIDNLSQEHLIYQFQNLGIKSIIGVSAIQGYNIAELFERVEPELFPPEEESDSSELEEEEIIVRAPEVQKPIKIAVIGRPNVGKSTLMNCLLEEDRCVVSPLAGTTRDNIDALIEFEGQEFLFIDTAGIRRRRAEHEVVDKFAAIRTEQAIERTDVCILMLDAQEGMSSHDKRIAKLIEDSGKGCIILFNKWDLVKGFRMEHCKKAAQEMVPFVKHCPMLFISALTGRNTAQIFAAVNEVYTSLSRRISTGQLNRFISGALQQRHPPMIQGKRLRIYYMTQISANPPIFVLFINNADLLDPSYKKYLINQLREKFEFKGVPLVLQLRGKEDENKRKKSGPPVKREEITARSVPGEKKEAVESDWEDFELEE